MSVVLGLNEFFHDTAAALVVDGRLVALIEQERLDRRKHAEGFALLGPPPWEAIRWCLTRAGLSFRDVDRIAVSFDADAPRALGILAGIVRGNLERASVRNTLRNRFQLEDPALRFFGGLTLGMARRRAFLEDLSRRCDAPVEVVNHHLAHAASAFFPSGFDDAAIVVLDGQGDACPTSLWEGRGDRLVLRDLEPDPENSLGILYRAISLALGFTFMDAGKTMGLAAWGRAREPYLSMLRPEGDRYTIDWPLVKRITRHHARYSGELQDVHRDMAASVQQRLEEVGVRLARRARVLARSPRICLAGGVALNCNMNARILTDEGTEGIWVQPGAMDMGCALGAALVAAQRAGDRLERGFDVYSGTAWSAASIEAALCQRGLAFHRVEDPADAAAERLARREIVGWFQGRTEFGPRALGSRSILANPDRAETRDRTNRVKQRELWRPLAPAILEEKASEWFEDAARSPYMTLTFRFRPDRIPLVPAVVHADGSARVQTVNRTDHPEFRRCIERFEARTGIPMVMNTSFNRRGEPIVHTPEEALASFEAREEMDCLVAGPFVVERTPGSKTP
ncbi:MAG: carbamoyltransferase [Deltaproteobacteria bacterium]|nr:carbamoyltransferase [Deltaproteobacteria bacterium]